MRSETPGSFQFPVQSSKFKVKTRLLTFAAHDGPYAREPQIEDLVRICRALNEAGRALRIPRRSRCRNRRHVVRREQWIGRQNRQVIDLRLGDEQAIERIAMMRR
jgi:hypothetical protein